MKRFSINKLISIEWVSYYLVTMQSCIKISVSLCLLEKSKASHQRPLMSFLAAINRSIKSWPLTKTFNSKQRTDCYQFYRPEIDTNWAAPLWRKQSFNSLSESTKGRFCSNIAIIDQKEIALKRGFFPKKRNVYRVFYKNVSDFF